MPASGLSAVVVESYKKLVLVSLLVPGRGPVVEGGDVTRLLPKYTSVVVARHVRHAASAYHEIAKAAQVRSAAQHPAGTSKAVVLGSRPVNERRDAARCDVAGRRAVRLGRADRQAPRRAELRTSLDARTRPLPACLSLSPIVVGFGLCVAQDNNLGLAKQVARYVVSRNIQRLTHTYVTLSLAGQRPACLS